MTSIPVVEIERPTADAPLGKRLHARSWLWFHLKIGLFGFGHGATMPLYEQLLVRDTKTMSPADFNQALSVALMLPGPSLVTLNMAIGKRLYGTCVAFLGVLAMCLPGAAWALLIARAVPIQHPQVSALFRGFTVGALVLLLAMLRRLHSGLRSQGAPAFKYAARIALAAGVALALQLGAPMVLVTLLGVALCLALEFLA